MHLKISYRTKWNMQSKWWKLISKYKLLAQIKILTTSNHPIQLMLASCLKSKLRKVISMRKSKMKNTYIIWKSTVLEFTNLTWSRNKNLLNLLSNCTQHQLNHLLKVIIISIKLKQQKSIQRSFLDFKIIELMKKICLIKIKYKEINRRLC